jgi:hypothetical protein
MDEREGSQLVIFLLTLAPGLEVQARPAKEHKSGESLGLVGQVAGFMTSSCESGGQPGWSALFQFKDVLEYGHDIGTANHSLHWYS